MKNRGNRVWWVLCACAATAAGAPARAQVGDSYKIQAPELTAPGRGSLAGSFSHTAFGPGDVERGSFVLPSAYSAPEERGPLLAAVFPSYSAEAGISEWGMGWATTLALTRWRESGDLDYATDDLVGPFGRCQRGLDGNWYPLGLSKLVRIESLADAFLAYTSDGTTWRFGQVTKIVTPPGAVPAGTYAWYLDEVETVTGRKASLTYDANPSGRPFLRQVDYGGTGTAFEHRITIDYASLTKNFTDYRSGMGLTLDRRVSAVTAWTRHATTREWQVRWSFTPTHRFDPVGPGFFLTQVQQTYSSGEKPPPVQYTYELSPDVLAGASLKRSSKFDPVVAAYAATVVLPAYSTVVDRNADGFADLEVASDNTLIVQGISGYTYEALPPASPTANKDCRAVPAASNLPRTLAAMRANSDEVQVVSLSSASNSTRVLLCDRAGEPLFQTTLQNNWTLGPKTRLVDLNRDHQPDLIQVYYNGYSVIPNTSTPTSYSFGAPVTGSLNLAFAFSGVWLQDFNGDGLPDIITRSGSLIVVYFNKGNFKFDQTPRTYEVRDSSGHRFDPSSYKFTWVDADNDGMIDLLLSTTTSAYLFRNAGDAFVPVRIGGQLAVSAGSTLPLFIDLNGSGNAEVFFILSGAGYAVALSSPATGLLKTADDGKGTRLTFTWNRAGPAAGIRSRHPILSSVVSESLGHGALTTTYQYGAPTVHSRGKFLVGYNQVTGATSVGSDSVAFLNGDFYSGLLASSRRHDVNSPLVDELDQRTYEDAAYQGLPWKRLKSIVHGWQTADGSHAVSERTDYESFEAEVCPRQTRRTGASGVLLTVATRAQIAGFGNSLHCLPAQVDTSGTHADSALDFAHSVVLSRNTAGLVTEVQSRAPGEVLSLQTVSYNADFTVGSMSSPGRGTVGFGYDPTTRLLTSTTLPDGTVVAVNARDSLTDGILELQTSRGTQTFHQFFRWDGQERLQKQWDDFGSASELLPAFQYAYRFATASLPAEISWTQLVDTATQSARVSVDLLTAGGEGLATASRIPEGWAFGHLTARERATSTTRKYLRQTLAPSADPGALDSNALFAGASEVGSQVASVFGHAADARTTFHAGVEQRMVKSLTVSGGLLALTSSENGTYTTTNWLDAGKRLIAFDDEAGTRYTYTYDALERLRAVGLPDGSTHVARYDGHGRLWRVERGGVATVETSFDPATGLVAAKRFLTPAGELVRTVVYDRDAIGRVTAETHTDAATGAAKTFRYYYDGATPAAPATRTTLGLLTATTGDGYTKLFEYRADGLLTKRTVTLTGWRMVESTFGYLESGVVGSRTTKLYDAVGGPLSASAHIYGYDGNGRLATESLNGAPFATYGYGGNGELKTATFANGDVLRIDYDDFTRRWKGSTQNTAAYTASTSMLMSARGLVDLETLTAGTTSLTRTYDYWPQRFLASSLDGRDSYGYGFDPFGLPTYIARNAVTKFITQTGSTLTAGAVTYSFDEIGRTTQRGALAVAYGPDGQIATATLGASNWNFRHDEAGNRLLKLSGTTPIAAYLEEGYLDTSGLTERVQVGGRTVGIVKNGVFTTVATDARGSVIAETNGTERIPSAFGQRDVHPSIAGALDYVEKGYDADLGFVRMGVRDYDPEINRFTTPDPLLLEEPSRCVQRPQECNLYSYAAADPVGNRDPTGKVVETPVDAAFVAFDIGSYIYHSITGNTRAAQIDTLAFIADMACLVTPVATGGGLVVRASAKAGEEVLLHAGTKEAGQALVKAEQLAVHGEVAAAAGGGRATTGFIGNVTVTSHGKVIGRGTVDVRGTVEAIESGRLAPRDIFQNRPLPGRTTPELPVQPPGYYKEFVHPTPGVSGVGPQRIVRGDGGELNYTPDHYKTFIPIN